MFIGEGNLVGNRYDFGGNILDRKIQYGHQESERWP